MSYPVGSRYGRDIGFAPAVPADVKIDAELYVNSDPANVRRASWSGKASPSGIYGAAQGGKNLPLDAPGEYYASVLATYKDDKGHLWVCSMRHAGVCIAGQPDCGARQEVRGQWQVRRTRDTNFEGYYDMTEQIGSSCTSITLERRRRSAHRQRIAERQQDCSRAHLRIEREAMTPGTRGSTASPPRTCRSRPPTAIRRTCAPNSSPTWGTSMRGPRPLHVPFPGGRRGDRLPLLARQPNAFGGSSAHPITATCRATSTVDRRRGIAAQGPGASYAGYLASAFILPPASYNNA